jgi:hypothetical protein
MKYEVLVVEILTDLLTIGWILVTTFLIFVAPFIAFSWKLLKREGLTLLLLTSFGLGIFFSAAAVILLAYFGYYTLWNFIGVYIALIILLYLWQYHSQLKKVPGYSLLLVQPGKLKDALNLTVTNSIAKISDKFKSYPVAILIVIVAIVMGFYLRLNFALQNAALFKPDSYGHLYLVKVLTGGQIFGTMLTFADYPRGFHAVVSLLNLFSGVDSFTLMRFIGGLFGVISIAAVYTLISSIHNRYSGALAALIYSISLFNITALYRIQSHATPEVLGFVMAPLVILFAYFTLIESKSEPAKSKRYLLVTVIFGALVLLIHPLTFLMVLNIILMMAVIAFVWRTKFDIRITASMVFLMVIFIIPPIIAEYSNLINWGASPQEILAVKRMMVPNAFNFLILTLAGSILVYGFFERKFNLIFVSSTCILFGIIYHTGMFMTPIHPVERTLPYFTMSITWLVAVAFVDVMGKLDTVWYSIPHQIKILVKIGQNRLDQAKTIQNQWLKRMGQLKARGAYAQHHRNYTRATQGAIFCIALYLITFIPVQDQNYDLFEYNKNIQPTLKIVEDFPMNSTVVYSATTFMVNFDKALIEPEGQHTELKKLIDEPPANFTPKRPYTFIFVENSSSTFKLLREGWPSLNTTEHLMYKAELWIEEYQNEYNNSLLYYESPELKVYLIFTVPLEQLVEDFGLAVGDEEVEESGSEPDIGNLTAVSSRMI